MITGAGGSIGSEIVRQTLSGRPKKIVMIEISEINLYSIESEINSIKHAKGIQTEIIGILGDVKDKDELEATNLLKKEFPRGSKVKVKPFGFEENVLLAKVFNIKGTKEMSDLLVTKDLTNKNCQDSIN